MLSFYLLMHQGLSCYIYLSIYLYVYTWQLQNTSFYPTQEINNFISQLLYFWDVALQLCSMSDNMGLKSPGE